MLYTLSPYTYIIWEVSRPCHLIDEETEARAIKPLTQDTQLVHGGDGVQTALTSKPVCDLPTCIRKENTQCPHQLPFPQDLLPSTDELLSLCILVLYRSHCHSNQGVVRLLYAGKDPCVPSAGPP